MKAKLKRFASQAVWSLCRLLPIKKNRIVFCSAGGRGFGDNPKAIALALLALQEELDLIWMTKDMKTPLPEGIRPCRYGSLRAAVAWSTAKVWVNDSRGGARYKKKKQKYLQTWHGFPLKYVEAAAKNLPEHYANQCKRDSGQIDLMVSGSEFMTRVYKEDFWYHGQVAQWGSPRNDVFFRPSPAANKVRDYFGLSHERRLLLYAPTFRDDGSMDGYHLDVRGALAACRERFGGEWTALCRLHPNAASLSQYLFPYDGSTVIDATHYSDMQELLLAADLLITDYSSSMFDFALSGKPCFRFACDLEAYEKNRGFYFPLDSLPFPLARSNEELQTLLQRFDEDAQGEIWDRFKLENGFREDGGAAHRCARWIMEQVKG